jgi:DNA-binding ferritin-like protein (Dps family)
MSNEQKEKFFSIILEAYEKGIASDQISPDMLIQDLKEKIADLLIDTDTNTNTIHDKA